MLEGNLSDISLAEEGRVRHVYRPEAQLARGGEGKGWELATDVLYSAKRGRQGTTVTCWL